MKQECLMIQKTQIKDGCWTYDPIGLCLVTECLRCENADYRIIDKDGKIIKDFKFYGLKGHDIRTSKYLIEFFDEVDYKDIEEYLNDENSDYRMTRIYSSENGKESIVMRPSKTDQKEELDKRKKVNEAYEESLKMLLGDESYKILCKVREEREKEENNQVEEKSKIKRLIKKIIKR